MKTIDFSPWPSFSNEEGELIKKILLSNKVNHWTGDQCRKFEKEFASWAKCKYAIALANGTLALDLALHALDVKEGDEVIVTPRSFIASASCVVNAGAKPVFADVERNSGNINAKSISSKISKRTKAVICVHIAGHPCEMDEIVEVCKKHDIFLIEDCSQAHGAEYKKQPVGSLGDIGCFSFCQDKIMTTGGEGGMVVTNNKLYWEKMWSFKDHGKNFELTSQATPKVGFRWVHTSIGSNFRMTEIQAGLGRYQLKKVADWNSLRNKNALKIIDACNQFPDFYRVPFVGNHLTHAWYKLNIFIHDNVEFSSEEIIDKFLSYGVPCFSGPCPEIYLEKAFDFLDQKDRFLPNANFLGKKSLMFLVHPTLTDREISDVCTSIKKVAEFFND